VTEPAPTAPPSPASPPPGAAVWASALEALATYVAHDVRNALNGVAVNLEVVRGRAARGADASSITPFAAAAATQFERASAAVEALLAFARPEPGDVDVHGLVARLARLTGVHGTQPVEIVGPPMGGSRTVAPPDIVRAAVARGVLSALREGRAACEITVDDGIFLRVTGADGASLSLDPELTALASAHGIRVAASGHTLELRFPVLGTDVTPYAPA
jgi:hypothetical protein